MWKFKASKYKNTTPRIPKKEDTITDLPIGNVSATNNAIQSSEKYLSFLIEGEGGRLAVLPLNDRGRRSRSDLNVICGHQDQICDFTFLPYHEELLVTCSRDDDIKIWKCDNFVNNGDKHITNPFMSFNFSKGKYCEALAGHHSADNILGIACDSSGLVANLETGQIVVEFSNIFEEKAMSLGWSEDGSLLAISGNKGKNVGIFDPRVGSEPIVYFNSHAGFGRESRVLFADGKFISSGFTGKRVQELLVYDNRNWNKSMKDVGFNTSTGILIPLYDKDTKLLVLAGKGSGKLILTEILNRDPYVSAVTEQSLADQTVGACLINKKSCKIMDGEVQRFHQLTKTSIQPISLIVPRRSYREFHADLYPDTFGNIPGSTAEEWIKGSNNLPKLISLSPENVYHSHSSNTISSINVVEDKPSTVLNNKITSVEKVVTQDSILEEISTKPVCEEKITISVEKDAQTSTSNQHSDCSTASLPDTQSNLSVSPVSEKENIDHENDEKQKECNKDSPVKMRLRNVELLKKERPVSLAIGSGEGIATRRRIIRNRPKSCVVGTLQSKYRHCETLNGPKIGIFSNLRNVNTRLPIDSNGMCVSERFAAIPLSGTSGLIAIFSLKYPNKIPDGVLDGLQNRSLVTDIAWNPFNPRQLACGLDIGIVHIWEIDETKVNLIGETEYNIPDDSKLKLCDLEPIAELRYNASKITQLRYHPTAKDLLTVAYGDCSICIFNIKLNEIVFEIKNAHEYQILSISWSYDGTKLATLGKDKMLKIFQPQLEGEDCCIAEKKVLESTRSARVLFVCDDSMILIVSFSRTSNRQCTLLDSFTLKDLHQQQIDTNTQPLIPHYDYDSSILFLTGKGDHGIQMFELSPSSPYMLPLAPFTALTGHQTIALHQKNVCDVKAVEFQRGWRLTEKALEKLSFRVPRVKKELFQRDLFPDALITWSPLMDGEQWIRNETVETRKTVNLCPEGMHDNI
ncbi:Coronin [Strongyloides ratti]|uniref:Coronin n=1 Tax=Strongyloides ratti TaxID=34506 RepID=A0A090LEA0_STRRB|nr:Coronin [Strongyloides ratti]CEF68077.1 Coronin [Strongyloides ratti]